MILIIDKNKFVIPVFTLAVTGKEVSSTITALSIGPERLAHTVTVDSSVTEYSL